MGFEIIGVGGFEHKSPVNNRYIPVSTIVKEANLSSVNTISLWIPRGWKKEWYPAQEVNRHIVQQGFIPMFVLYWFADDISISYIRSHRDEYIAYLKTFRDYLDEVEGDKIILLNPEYNEHGVGEWDGYNDLLLESKKILDHGDIKIGPCVGDFGIYDKSFDKENWKKFHPSLRRSIGEFDFIAFQEMRGLTRNKPIDYEMIAKRIESFSTYLHATYNKPVLLGYIALSSWGNEGEKLQSNAIDAIVRRQDNLRKSGLMGLNLFHLVDFPHHVGYFNEAEHHFGIMRSNLQNKPAFESFKHLRLKKPLK